MKLSRKMLLLSTVLLAIALSSSAWAHRPHRHHHSGAHVGVVIGAPLFWPWYAHPWHYPYPYYPPVVTVPSSPPVYIEKGDEESESSGYWYYCAESEAYYPYVKDCPGGWKQVVPQAPPGR